MMRGVGLDIGNIKFKDRDASALPVRAAYGSGGWSRVWCGACCGVVWCPGRVGSSANYCSTTLSPCPCLIPKRAGSAMPKSRE